MQHSFWSAFCPDVGERPLHIIEGHTKTIFSLSLVPDDAYP